MNKKRSTFFYIFILTILGITIYWILHFGQLLQPANLVENPNSVALPNVSNHFTAFKDNMAGNFKDPLSLLLLQIIVIIATARFFGFLFKKIGQPAVIGEITAGILLGPSVLGKIFPVINDSLFPSFSLLPLQFISQVGLILFMFIIGMELDVKAIRKQAYGAVIISHASIIIPYTLGMALAYFLYLQHAPKGISFLSFSLFIGITMSITAFPVLARIMQERGLTKTRLGSLVLTCAAADDLTAWCILAAVIALVKSGSSISSLYIIGFSLLYVLLMLKIIKPRLEQLALIYSKETKRQTAIIAFLFMILIASSYFSSIIGIHALFGAFMAGLIMPSGLNFRKILIEKIEDVSTILLLPLFFVITGLRTQLGLLNEGHLWVSFGWIVLVAIAGKFGGSMVAARVTGQTWKDSLSIGVLMNTRGLMQLIVLNIGYDLGILSAQIFSMMVLMALLTTLITCPALDLISFLFRKKAVTGSGKVLDNIIENQTAL